MSQDISELKNIEEEADPQDDIATYVRIRMYMYVHVAYLYNDGLPYVHRGCTEEKLIYVL